MPYTSKEKIREAGRRHDNLPHRVFRDYVKSAEKRKHHFFLTLEEFSKLLTEPCFYCGAIPNPRNGVDRVDNSVGYELWNCVTACRTCNYMKQDSTLKDFVEKCTAISKKHKGMEP